MADDGKIDPHSPYYLGSGDQPGNMITHVILYNDNYISWARAIKLSSKARRKFVFVDGTFTKPMEKKKQLDWDTVNSMLVSWNTRTLDPNWRPPFLFMMKPNDFGIILRSGFAWPMVLAFNN